MCENEIQDFICDLKKIKNSCHISNYNGLVNVLQKLSNMIGMENVKKNIILQIKYYLVNKSRNTHGLDSHMFHTVILGPPGCGKTHVAKEFINIILSNKNLI